MVLALVAAALIFWRRCWRMTWRKCFVIRDGGCRLAHALWIARARLHNWSTMRLPRSISEPLGEVQKCGPICRGPIIGWLRLAMLLNLFGRGGFGTIRYTQGPQPAATLHW